MNVPSFGMIVSLVVMSILSFGLVDPWIGMSVSTSLLVDALIEVSVPSFRMAKWPDYSVAMLRSYRIRRGTKDDLPFLCRMLLEAAFWRAPEAGPRPPEALNDPYIRRYVAGWGRADDAAVIAEETSTGTAIGAAWYRLLRPPEQGYGYIDEETPEVSIAVAAEARGRGVGTALLGALAELARSQGYEALSLSVEKDNPACRLYLRCGYAVVGENGNAWTMRRSVTADLFPR